MSKLMSAVFISLFIVGPNSWAAAEASHGKANNVLVNAGFWDGTFSLGGAYEYLYNGSQSIGGQLLLVPKNSGTPNVHDGYTIVGFISGFHFFKGDWDLAFTPSFNIINISFARPSDNTATNFGPGVSVSLTTTINDRVGIGFDFTNYWIWSATANAGFQLSDLFFKLKIGF